MPRIAHIEAVSPMLAALLCLLTLNPSSHSQISQISGDNAAHIRSKLEALQKCTGQDGSAVIADLSHGLLIGWKNTPGLTSESAPLLVPHLLSSPPTAYIDSLERDLKACKFAAALSDNAKRRTAMSAVLRDIEIKSQDCHKFGMGRSVSVRVTTRRGAATDNGWQVFYKWISASQFESDELRFPQVTSPAIFELPPGQYMFRAEKKVSSAQVMKVDPVTIVVALQPAVEVQFVTP